MTKSDSVLTKENFIEFFKFYGFGIEDDQFYGDIISNVFDYRRLFSDEQSVQGRQDIRENTENYSKPQTPIKKTESKTEDNQYIEKLRNNLKHFGRKSLFSLIKHFKYYDNGTKFINKNDFVKVMRDFRLNLTVTEIEKLFEIYCGDKKQMLLNYEHFVLCLCNPLNEARRNLVDKVYESLKQMNKTIVDIELVKSFYNAKKHPLGKDEDDTFAEFIECIETFHYSYKSKKANTISYEEFEEFYRIISFLIEDDSTFYEILVSEWKKVFDYQEVEPKKKVIQQNNYTTDNIVQKKQPQNIQLNDHQYSSNIGNEKFKQKPESDITPIPLPKQNQRPVTPLSRDLDPKEKELGMLKNQYSRPQSAQSRQESKSDPIARLKEKLKKRGVRGLMNLHKQFLLNCKDLNGITYGDLVKVLKLQRIDFSKDDYDFLFEKFKVNTKNSLGIGSSLNFSGFIRHFKQILSKERLLHVEKVFSFLDTERTEMLFIEDVKLRFDASHHPDVLRKIRSEDDIMMEFLDCFELNYNFLV